LTDYHIQEVLMHELGMKAIQLLQEYVFRHDRVWDWESWHRRAGALLKEVDARKHESSTLNLIELDEASETLKRAQANYHRLAVRMTSRCIPRAD
jgi:hypothetical protein